jgi:hypothetical protein
VAPALPPDIKISPLFDQSVFVKAAIQGVVAEALIAAGLTAAMVLLFLGNWRSTLIIALTIPLSILASILVLFALGETLNIMTLGGLALSVGILVDQAIVTIENIERHLHLGKPLLEAIEVGAGEIGVPAFVSTLCICIVFVPMFFLSGVARFLFVPLAEAVVFAMIASYFLSRTLVPTLVMLLMGGRMASARRAQAQPAAARVPRLRPPVRAPARAYIAGAVVAAGAPAPASACCSWLLPAVVPAGALPGARLLPDRGRRPDPPAHARAHRHPHRGDGAHRRPGGSGDPPDRAEGGAGDHPRQPRHPQQRHQPLVQQRRHHRHAGRRDPAVAEAKATGPPSTGCRCCAASCPSAFPGIEFFFQPADIVTQILNFGLPAAIDVQFTGNDLAGNAELAAN